MTQKTKAVKCARDAMAYPSECFSLPTDGRKAKHIRIKRRELFIQLALYADSDGTRSYPGEKRLCKELSVSRRTLERLIADLKELGCAIEAVGTDGKSRLHGPRGNTERFLSTKPLPLPGSTAWEAFPDGVRRLVYAGWGCTFDKEGKPVWFGLENRPTDAPNSGEVARAVAPNSAPVAPLLRQIAPLLRQIGTDSEDVLPPQTATTPTATNKKTGEEGVVHLQRAYLRHVGMSLEVSKKYRPKLTAMLAGFTAAQIDDAVSEWKARRTAPAAGLKFPVGPLLEALPEWLVWAKKHELENTITPEMDAAARARILEQSGLTEEEWAEIEGEAKA
jgi:biotin operon repressor